MRSPSESMDHLIFFLNSPTDEDILQLNQPSTDFHTPTSLIECYNHDKETFGVDDFFQIAGKDFLKDLMTTGPQAIAEDRKGFLQSWLFFGLLSLFLCKDISVSDFVVNESRFLTTRKLPQLINTWVHEMNTAESELRLEVTLIDDALHVAYEFVSIWYRDDGSDGIPPELWQSLAILGETLCHARSLCMFNTGNINNRPWGSTNSIAGDMIRKGWCKHAVSMVRQSMTNTSGLYVANLLPPPPGHEYCTEKRCQPIANYREGCPNHKSSCTNQCACLEVDTASIKRILKEGGIPLICLQKRKSDRDGKMVYEEYVNVQCYQAPTLRPPSSTSNECLPHQRQFSPMAPSVFVAISHVWADGLGNKTANSLPYCQISDLQDMVDGMYPEEAQDRPVFFWLDTLCIPLDSTHRTLGIQSMTRVYENAGKVLVLDNDLRCFGQHNGLEPLVRINMSKWARRLWTLQEGSLSKSLFFKFDSRKLLNSIDIEKRVSAAEKYNKHLSWLKMARIFSPTIRSLQQPTTRNKVAHLWRAVRWRTTQEEKDETVCLASLLAMDLRPLLRDEDTAESRMCHFINVLSQQPGIPPWIIFLPGHKLNRKGFRWAPRSWMISHAKDQHEIHLLEEDAKPAKLYTAGLRVKYSGIKLQFKSARGDSGFHFTNGDRTSWYRLKYPNGAEEYGTRKPPWLGVQPDKLPPLWLILSRPKLEPSPNIALLVSETSVQTDPEGRILLRYVNRVSNVWVNVVVDGHEITEAKSRFRAREEWVQGDIAGDLKWCIDAEVVCPLIQYLHDTILTV